MTPKSTHRSTAFNAYTPTLHHDSDESFRASGRRSAQTGANVIARQYKELHGLLRRRLLITVSVCVGFFGLLPIGSVLYAIDNWVPAGARAMVFGQPLVALSIGFVGILIWQWPPKRLRHLRELELGIFAIVVAYLIVSNGYLIDRFGLMNPPIGPVRHPTISLEIGRASCRERVEIAVGRVLL